MKRLITALAHPRQYRWLALRPWRRHSLVLLVAGIMHVLLGVSYALPSHDPGRDEALRIALAFAPLPVWGGTWVITGLIAILSARWPPASETWGYSAMAGMSTLWASCIGAGVVLGSGIDNVTGALVFTVLAFLWWAISGLMNPEDWPAPDDEQAAP